MTQDKLNPMVAAVSVTRKIAIFTVLFTSVFTAFITPTAHAESAKQLPLLSLESAVNVALKNDPWLTGNSLNHQAVLSQYAAVNRLPNPTISLGLMNLPIDTWDLDQEGMTQLKVGVSQMLPRGDSIKIRQAQLQTQAEKYPLMHVDRQAKIQSLVTQLWLDVYLSQQTIQLINQDKILFDQMADIAKASYSSAVGNTRQQDVIRAQLELIQLEDRLMEQRQSFDESVAKLNAWLHQLKQSESELGFEFNSLGQEKVVESSLPVISLNHHLDKSVSSTTAMSRLANEIMAHPALLLIDKSYQVSLKESDLLKEKLKPQWGFNASYAHRDNAPNEVGDSSVMGGNRADFFSVGMTFDLPMFSQTSQEHEINAALTKAEAVKTEKLLLMKNMLMQIDKEQRQLSRLKQRQSLYNNQLLKQTREQTEATLSAYTTDDGDFSDIVRARISELNTRILALEIDVNVLKTTARLNYFFTDVSHVKQQTRITARGEK